MIGSLSELASMPSMPSEVTLRKLIGEHVDFPIRSRGKNGIAYEFDLAEAHGFILKLREREEEQARARSEEIRQFGLDLLGGDAATTAPVGLSPADQKALLETELAAIKVAEKRGQLVRRESVEAALGEFLIWIGQYQSTFMARLAKRVDVPREVLTQGDRLIEMDRHAIANRMERIRTDAASVVDDAGDPAVRDGLDDPGAVGTTISSTRAADGQPMV